MDFNDFNKIIYQTATIDLPAATSHLKMIPFGRTIEQNVENVRQAAVMMLFYPKNNEPYIVLIIRNSYEGVHSSQIAFPGGKVEDFDANLEATALRETYEEIGVEIDKMKIIRAFTSVYIAPSNFMVFPFLGISNEELSFNLQEDEVAGIVEIPLKTLLDDSIITTEIISTSYANLANVPIFKIGEHTVWGATAMMLSELKDVLKMIV